MVQDALHGVKARAGSSPQPPQLCYYLATFGCRVLKCRCLCRWPRETPGEGIEEPSFLPQPSSPSFFFAIVFSFTFVFTIVFNFALVNTHSFNIDVTRGP